MYITSCSYSAFSSPHQPRGIEKAEKKTKADAVVAAKSGLINSPAASKGYLVYPSISLA